MSTTTSNQTASTSRDYTLRELEDADLHQALALLGQGLAGTEATRKTSEFWRWKHNDNPYGRSYVNCATPGSSSEVVALRALMRWSFNGRREQVHLAYRPVDTVTRSDHQRRGLFSTLTKRAISDLEHDDGTFIFNTPNQNSLPGYLKMGWQVVGRLPLFARPVGLRLPNILRRPSASFFLETWEQFRRRISATEIADVAASHEHHRPRVGYRSVRSLEFLDWRYGQHPNVTYEVYSACDPNGRLVSFLVGRKVRGFYGLSAFILPECFARDAAADALKVLLRSFLAARPAAYVMAHFAEGTVERRVLNQTRFFRLPGRGYTLAARPLGGPAEELVDPANWDLTLCELEGF